MGSLSRLFPMLALATLLLVPACSSEPVVIGFLGPLEGRLSDLGVQGRNGAALAVEDINAAGGVAGRPLLLLPMNDANDETEGRAAVRALGQRGAVAVVGPMTSAVAVAVQPQAAALGLAVVSPTVSTAMLSGRDDNFFRVIPTGSVWASSLGRQCRADGLTRVATVCDLDNAAFALSQVEHFMAAFTAAGGVEAADIRLHGARQRSWSDVAERLLASRAEAVYAALSARDLALLARDLRLSGAEIPIYSSMWAFTQEILQAGGRSAEGIVFAAGYDEGNPLPAFQDFKRRYRNRFGHAPSFAASYGYEAVQVLAQALGRTRGNADGLVQALKTLGPVQGVQGPLRFDAWGDVQRPYYHFTIRDQTFVTLRGLQP